MPQSHRITDCFPEIDYKSLGPAHDYINLTRFVDEWAHTDVEEIGDEDNYLLGNIHAVPISGDAIARFRQAMKETS